MLPSFGTTLNITCGSSPGWVSAGSASRKSVSPPCRHVCVCVCVCHPAGTNAMYVAYLYVYLCMNACEMCVWVCMYVSFDLLLAGCQQGAHPENQFPHPAVCIYECMYI